MRAHTTSDEAFAVDTPSLLPALFPAAILSEPQAQILKPEEDETSIEEESERLLSLWKFFFATEAFQARSEETLGKVLGKLYPGLVVVSGLRNGDLSRLAAEVLGSVVNTCGGLLDKGAGEVIWGAVRMLLKEGTMVDTVLSLWLRWINTSNSELKPTEDILKQEEYWRLIQVLLYLLQEACRKLG